MILFNGLDEVIKSIIASTSYLDANDPYAQKTDEERFQNTMNALFGPDYPDTYKKPPTEFAWAEMMEIHKKKKSGESLEGAIKSIIDRRMKKPDPKDTGAQHQYEVFRNAAIERAKKWYQRSIEFFAEEDRVENYSDAIQSVMAEDVKLYEGQRAEVFQVLRKAGWPI